MPFSNCLFGPLQASHRPARALQCCKQLGSRQTGWAQGSERTPQPTDLLRPALHHYRAEATPISLRRLDSYASLLQQAGTASGLREGVRPPTSLWPAYLDTVKRRVRRPATKWRGPRTQVCPEGIELPEGLWLPNEG